MLYKLMGNGSSVLSRLNSFQCIHLFVILYGHVCYRHVCYRHVCWNYPKQLLIEHACKSIVVDLVSYNW